MNLTPRTAAATMPTAEDADGAGPAVKAHDHVPLPDIGPPPLFLEKDVVRSLLEDNGRGKSPKRTPATLLPSSPSSSWAGLSGRTGGSGSGAANNDLRERHVQMITSMKILQQHNPALAARIEAQILDPSQNVAVLSSSERKWYQFFDADIPGGHRGKLVTEAAKKNIHITRRKSHVILAKQGRPVAGSASKAPPSSLEDDFDANDSSISVGGTSDGRPDLNNLDIHDKFVFFTTMKMGVEQHYRVFTNPSLGFIKIQWKFRQRCIDFFILNSYFDYFVLFSILINCVILVLNNPPEWTEIPFLCIFTIEMAGKVCALGFVPYLRDPWNLLDFIVVLIGFFSFIPALGNYSAVRALRVFRAFKAVTAVPGLQLMVRALAVCMKAMVTPGMLILFALFFFGIIGLSTFMGILRQTCVCLPEGYDADPLLANYTAEWSHDSSLLVEGYQHCGTVSGSRRCPTDPSYCASAVEARTGWDGLNVSAVCLPLGDNPGDGFTNFDNIGWALLSTIQLLTMDWWESIYDGVLQSAGWYTIFYFILVIFVGGYYALNLILAVVTMAYADTKAEVEEEVADLVEEKMAISARKKIARAMQKLVIVRQMSVQDSDTNVDAMDEKQKEKSYFEAFACARALKRVVEHNYFVNTIVILIVTNTVCLACWYPLMPEWADQMLSALNYVFSAAFLIEMVLKMGAYGIKEYFFHVYDHANDSPNRSSRQWNWFDSTVVVSSAVELVLALSDTSDTQGLSVLRSFRIVRILKLGKNWTTMHRLIAAIGSSIENIAYLTIVLVIVIYMFAALGMQMFRDDYFKALNVTSYEEVRGIMEDAPELYESAIPRWNFTDFPHSFMFVFRVLCGEWIEPLHSAMLFSSKGASITFFLFALVVGNFVVMNLFIALLLGAFSEQQMEETQTKIKEKEAAALAAQEQAEEAEADAGAMGPVRRTTQNLPKIKGDGESNHGQTSQAETREDAPPVSPRRVITTQQGSVSAKYERMMSGLCCCSKQLETSLHASRIRVVKLITSNGFEGIILLMILWSSIMLGFDDHPNRDNQKLHILMDKFNIVFAVVFTTEALLKIFGFGWKSYFRDGWNILDFCLVVIGLAAVIVANVDMGSANSSSLTALRTLRALRALRPMRAIRRWESMKVIIDALLASIPAIANVIVFTMLVFIIFAIMGVQLFGGKFGYCADFETGEALSHTITANRTVCNSTEVGFDVVWQNPPLNFDDTFNAMVSLFHVAIFEGWMQVMDSSTDSVGVEMQPIYKNSMSSYVFYVIFICFASFFTLNLFIGVIIDNFQARKKYLTEMGLNNGLFLTEKQKRLMDAIRNALTKKPLFVIPAPKSCFPKLCFRVAQSTWFEILVLVVICINAIFLMMTHYEQSDWYTQMLWIANAAFTAFYTAEAAMKIAGLRGYYFKSAWNIFDFGLVVIAIASCIIDLSFNMQQPWIALTGTSSASNTASSLARLFRILRVLRFGKLLKFFPRFRRLTTTLIISVPALINIFSLLFMIISIFALVGLSLFKDIKRNGAMNDFINFETFGSAFMLLYRVSSSAGVDEVAEACSILPPFCNETFYSSTESNCGSAGPPKLFFVTFVLLAFFIMVNTYIAVILENLDNISSEEAQSDGITAVTVDSFYEIWGQYDPKATNFIDCRSLQKFLSEVPAPLGYKGSFLGCTDEDLKKLEIPLFTNTSDQHNHPTPAHDTSAPSSLDESEAPRPKKVRSRRFSLRRSTKRNKVGPADSLHRSTKRNEVGPDEDATTFDEGIPKAHCTSILKIMIERTLNVGVAKGAEVKNDIVEMLIQQSTSKKFRDLSDLGAPFSHTGIYNAEERIADLVLYRSKSVRKSVQVNIGSGKVLEGLEECAPEKSIAFPIQPEHMTPEDKVRPASPREPRRRGKSASRAKSGTDVPVAV